MLASLKDAYRGRCVCVTGGAGFIGSHLCEALSRLGATTHAVESTQLSANELGDQCIRCVDL